MKILNLSTILLSFAISVTTFAESGKGPTPEEWLREAYERRPTHGGASNYYLDLQRSAKGVATDHGINIGNYFDPEEVANLVANKIAKSGAAPSLDQTLTSHRTVDLLRNYVPGVLHTSNEERLMREHLEEKLGSRVTPEQLKSFFSSQQMPALVSSRNSGYHDILRQDRNLLQALAALANANDRWWTAGIDQMIPADLAEGKINETFKTVAIGLGIKMPYGKVERISAFGVSLESETINSYAEALAKISNKPYDSMTPQERYFLVSILAALQTRDNLTNENLQFKGLLNLLRAASKFDQTNISLRTCGHFYK